MQRASSKWMLWQLQPRARPSASPSLSAQGRLDSLAGPRAVSKQRETHERFAKLLRRLVTRGRKHNPELKPLMPVLVALASPVRKLHTIAPTIIQLLAAALEA